MEIKNSKTKSFSDNICKCCLRNGETLKDLWEVNFLEGDREIYGEMITKCFAIAWQKPVDRTELICELCVKTLLIAFKFKRDVLASERILLEQLEDEDAENISDNLVHSEEIGVDDNMEDLKDFEAVYLEDSIRVGPAKTQKDVTACSSVLKHPSPGGMFDQDMPNSPSLKQHKCTNAPNTSSCVIEEQEGQKSDKFTCDICKGDFKLKSSLFQHILDSHKYRKKGKMLFTCKTCNKLFSRTSHLVTHQRLHTGEKPYSCKICNKQFARSSTLITHQRIHTGEKPYSCKICDKQFSQLSALIAHKRIHTGDKPYSCKFCNKQFSRSSTLIMHQRIHTGDKPYSCEICNKQFPRKSSLITHQRIHTGDKPFSCKICDKQFSDASVLNRHQRVHTGEKPYSCKICNKQFSVSSHLITHQRVHTGEKPYSCKICNKQFSVSSALIRHQRVHTGDKPLKVFVSAIK